MASREHQAPGNTPGVTAAQTLEINQGSAIFPGSLRGLLFPY